MGLFDFLKKPDSTPATPPTPTPAEGSAPAKPAGPRYQGSNYTTPAEPAMPTPAMPPQFEGQELGIPPMPPMPEFPYEPQNILEQLLLLAGTQEQARPAFYQALLGENIIMVLAPEDGLQPGEVQLAEGQQIQLQVLQDGRLPIFSSPARLQDGNLDHSNMSWVWIPGQAFFNMTQGQEVVLNPFSAAGKLLPTEEIQALLSGQLTQQNGLPPDAQVSLAAPTDLPEGLAEALASFGSTHPTIEAIYLAQMQLVGAPAEEPARLLLGFVTTDQQPEFMQDLGPALEGRTGTYQHVDLMLLDMNSGEGVNPYFQQPEVQPVYQA